jgi:anti-sigma factor RsiW
MTLLTCAAVRRRLQAFYDRELPVGELISVEAHLHDCPPCTRDLREMQDVGHALRLAAAPAPSDDWRGVRSSVISRMRAEEHESWLAKVRRAFDDLHLVWVALAPTAATCVCAGSVLSMLHFASPERETRLRP